MKRITKVYFLSLAVLLSSSLISTAQNEGTNATVSKQSVTKTDIVFNDATRGMLSVGDQISTMVPSGIAQPWGVGFDRSTNLMYVTQYNTMAGADTIIELDLAGNQTGNKIIINAGQQWIADMAIGNGFLYAVMVSGPNNIQVVDLSTGIVVNTIGGAFTGISQRGLAYDAVADEFYIGGWNDNIIYHVDATGAPIDQFSFSNISGLEWHPAGGPSGQGSLWVVTNEILSTVTELDPHNGWTTLQSFNIPGNTVLSGAGLALNTDGNLWIPNQVDDVIYLIDSGEPLNTPVPIGSASIILSIVLIGSFLFIRRG